MKYIKTFEKKNRHFYKDQDYVKLIKLSKSAIEYNYKLGDICIINSQDEEEDYKLGYYELENVTGDSSHYLWVKYNEIEPVNDIDINIIKYNL
jgi:hypothetical protein